MIFFSIFVKNTTPPEIPREKISSSAELQDQETADENGTRRKTAKQVRWNLSVYLKMS